MILAVPEGEAPPGNDAQCASLVQLPLGSRGQDLRTMIQNGETITTIGNNAAGTAAVELSVALPNDQASGAGSCPPIELELRLETPDSGNFLASTRVTLGI